MSAEEKYELFEDYLNDALTDIQRTDFEHRMKEDNALREEFDVFREARHAISERLKWEESEKPFMKTLESLSKEHFKTGKEAKRVPISRGRMLQLMSAAAVLLLVVLIWQPWQKDLYSRFAQHPRAELTQRNGSQTLANAERSFNNKDYKSALSSFTSYLSDHPDDIDILFYQGICHLELGNSEQAKNNFRQLFNTSQPYRDMGAWYLGLSFLKEENADSTLWYLNQIGASSEYNIKANALLKKISL